MDSKPRRPGWRGAGVRKGAEAVGKTAWYHQDGQHQDVSSLGLGQDYFTEHLLIGGLIQSSPLAQTMTEKWQGQEKKKGGDEEEGKLEE